MKTLTNRTIRKAIAGVALLVFVAAAMANTNEKIGEIESAEEVAIESEIILDVEVIELELWMTNPSGWTADRMDFTEIDFEESVSFESWMTNLSDKGWEMEREGEIELEAWMLNIDNATWATHHDEEESEELEGWMLNPAEWLVK